MAELGITNVKNDRISDLVDQSSKNDQLEYPLFGSSKLSDFVFEVPIVFMAPVIFANPS